MRVNPKHGSIKGNSIILEKAVASTQIAQPFDLLCYMKKALITNKVTTHFFITPFKSTCYTLHALPTAFSRIILKERCRERPAPGSNRGTSKDAAAFVDNAG